MKINSPENVKSVIAESQDGGNLDKPCRFNDFFNACILHNTNYNEPPPNEVNLEDLISDFNYMISQLKWALNALENIEK